MIGSTTHSRLRRPKPQIPDRFSKNIMSLSACPCVCVMWNRGTKTCKISILKCIPVHLHRSDILNASSGIEVCMFICTSLAEAIVHLVTLLCCFLIEELAQKRSAVSVLKPVLIVGVKQIQQGLEISGKVMA
jgi:hypothetical protein